MEREFTAWLAARVGRDVRLPLGLVDDAALLAMDNGPVAGKTGRWVATVDMITDGVDFRLGEVDARRVGRKALAVNLSDLAAMAARPVAALAAVALPRHGALELARELYEGLLQLAGEYDVLLAGGDTNTWDGPLAISVTLLGQTTQRGPLVRSGARPGDAIVVTGRLGGSLLGRHFDFSPRVREALLLHERYELHAGMDISDGLTLDLSRLAEASGCGAELRLADVPIDAAAKQLAAESPTFSALEHALSDGEDFELLLAMPAAEARRLVADQPLDVPVTCVGAFVAERGLWSIDAKGTRAPLEPRGYLHGASP